MCNLILSSLFCFSNMWDSNTLFLWVPSSSIQCIVLNLFQKWSFFILDFTAPWDLFPHYSNPSLNESCVIIDFIMSVCSSFIFIHNMFAYGWSYPWSSNWATAIEYLDPAIMGINIVLSGSLLFNTCALLGFPLDVLVSCPRLFVVLLFPLLVLLWWVLLIRATILILRVVEYLFGPPDWDISLIDPLDSLHFQFLVGPRFHPHSHPFLWARHHHLQLFSPYNQ